jgi:hypothetical protein
MSCKIFGEAKEKILAYVEKGDYDAMCFILTYTRKINFIIGLFYSITRLWGICGPKFIIFTKKLDLSFL